MLEQDRLVTEIRTPSKRSFGRLKNVFDSCQLTLVGGDFDGQKAKSYQFNGCLPTFDYGAKFTQVLGKMLLVGDRSVFHESNIEGLGGVDFQNLPGIAAQITMDAKPAVIIRLVYGATKLMPFRALSYLLPPLIYMENLISAGVTAPQLQVIFVNNISSQLDRMDYSVVENQARRFAIVARDYVHEFFPHLEDKTVFLEDTPLLKGSELRKRLTELARSLKRLDPSDILDDVESKAANNGARRTYAFYGSAHVLIHDIDIPASLVPLVHDQSEIESNPNIIISMGGKKEEIFYKLRHALKPHLGSEYNRAKTLQYFTRHRVPPYYMARGGDISLEDVVTNWVSYESCNIAPAAKHDIDYLYNVSEERKDFNRFLKKLTRRKYG